MVDANTFTKSIYEGDSEPLTLSGFGSKRQTKSSNSKTPVDTNPQMKDARTMTDDKNTKSYDRNNRPNDHRPSSVDFPKQPYSPIALNQHLTKMWNDSIEANTKRSQRLQRPGNK
jgi:hypothetical protein